MSIIDALKKSVNKAVATGINRTLNEVMRDLRTNAPRRSGRLVSGFSITKRATPGNPEGQIENSVSYSDRQYPYRLYYFSPRHPASYPSPSLFTPLRESPKGVLSEKEVSTAKIEALMRANVEQALREAFK